MHDKKDHEVIKTDSLLRDTSSHYIRLIGDADRKARIMIVVNSILLTAGVTVLTRVIDNVPLVWVSAVLLIISNLVTLFFSILSVKPDLHIHIAKETKNHILHYTKCIEYSLGEYTELMLKTMESNEKKIDAVIKDVYFFGNLLNRKYKLIKIAFRFFFWGIASSVVSYLFILLINH